MQPLTAKANPSKLVEHVVQHKRIDSNQQPQESSMHMRLIPATLDSSNVSQSNPNSMPLSSNRLCDLSTIPIFKRECIVQSAEEFANASEMMSSPQDAGSVMSQTGPNDWRQQLMLDSTKHR